MFYPKTPFTRRPEITPILLKENPSALEQLLPWLTQTPTMTSYRVNVLKTTVASFKERIETLLAEKYAFDPPKVFIMAALPEVVFIDAAPYPRPEPNPFLREVIVDAGCAAACLRGAHIYAPGVLAIQAGARIGEMVQVYCDLASKCVRGTITRYESESKIFIGLGRVLKQRHELYVMSADNKLPCGVAIEMLSTISGVPPLGNLSSCQALLQNVPSIVAVYVLDPKPNERILDMCAAPGNKTTHIAELIGDKGTIIALDKNENKVKRIRDKIWKNGLDSVHPFAFDSTKVYAEIGDGGNDLNDLNNLAPPYAAEIFDRILLDAPCTGLGNRPLLHCTLTAAQFPSFPKLQKQFVANAIALLKPTGVLVYSTCTITEEENEGIIAWIIEKYPQMQLVAAFPKHGGDGLPNAGLTMDQRKLVQRFGPTWYNYNSHVDTIGFFIAKFIKRAAPIKESC